MQNYCKKLPTQRSSKQNFYRGAHITLTYALEYIEKKQQTFWKCEKWMIRSPCVTILRKILLHKAVFSNLFLSKHRKALQMPLKSLWNYYLVHSMLLHRECKPKVHFRWIYLKQKSPFCVCCLVWCGCRTHTCQIFIFSMVSVDEIDGKACNLT